MLRRNQSQRAWTHWSISAQVQFHVVVASKYTVLRGYFFFLRAGDFFLAGLFLTAGFFFAGLRRGFAWRRGGGAAVGAGSHDFLAAGLAAGFLAAGFAAGLRAAGFATVFFLAGDLAAGLAAGLRAVGFFGGPLPEPARSRARSSRSAFLIGSSYDLNFVASYLKYSVFESLRAM